MDLCETIVETRKGNINLVRYNKPRMKNAIDREMYVKVKNILNNAAFDNEISVMVLTGTGDFYSSGNDFKAASQKHDGTKHLEVIHEYIKSFITFPKLLIAIVNGPAIGIAATTLALCDLVFASEDVSILVIYGTSESYFYTPFTKLGIVAEGCSTFTFPRLIGERKAIEMLLYNHKMTAREALECGFVNYLYKPEELQSKVWDKIVEVSKLPINSISLTKKMLKGTLQDQLLKANDREIEALNEIWYSGRSYSKL